MNRTFFHVQAIMISRILIIFAFCFSVSIQAGVPVRGSIVEDRAARKLLQAGDLRYDAGEQEKALEIWQSVVERYPRSKVRYQAHLKLGEHYLTKGNAYDKARAHFETVAAEENTDTQQRALATLKMGVCLFEGRHYGQCFKVMRKVIEEFPNRELFHRCADLFRRLGLGQKHRWSLEQRVEQTHCHS